MAGPFTTPVDLSIPFEGIEDSNGNLVEPPFESENVRDAIIEARNTAQSHFAQFQILGQANYDQYLYSNIHLNSSALRSGDASNGYRYTNCAPLAAFFDGRVSTASASITGLAVSTGTPADDINLKFELWKVGFDGEGESLGEINFAIDGTKYNIGQWWNSSVLTAFAEAQAQDVMVNAGDLLALKFIRQTSSSTIVSLHNATIVLGISKASL